MWKKLNEMEDKYIQKHSIEDLKDEIEQIYTSYPLDNKTASKLIVSRFHRYIVKSYKYLNSYGKYEAKKYLKRSKINNNEIVEFIIYIIYCKKQSELSIYQEEIMQNLVKYTYDTEIEKIAKQTNKKKPSKIDYVLLTASILNTANARGYIWQDYIDSITLYNANETYRHLLINETKGLEELLQKQKNRILKKKNSVANEDKYIGAFEDQLVYLINQVKLTAYESFGIEKVKFIGVHDSNQTEMCRTLENQEFYINKINIYKRYSDVAKGVVQYKTFGLKIGENLPPINNYFHYCRSSIDYIL